MVPLTLKFKIKLFSKGGVFADAGIAFSFLLSGSGKVNTSFDYEAIYSYDRNTGKFVFDSNVIPGNSDWLIQEDFIKSLNGNNVSSTDSYFQSRKDIGFDVALNKNINQSSTFKLKSGIALLLDGGLYYSILENADLCLGFMYLSDSKKNDSSSGYKITDKSGEYSSIVNGSEKITNNSVGITLGIKFSLK
jgi:hypothetical protein